MADEAHVGGSGIAGKVAIVAVLAITVGVVIYLKSRKGSASPDGSMAAANAPGDAKTPVGNADVPKTPLPKVLELGSTTCTPCKLMAKVLDELRKAYGGRLEVEFQDCVEDRGIARAWEVETIPTQIFLSPDGKEVFRHTGFFSKDDIVAKWKELGYDLDAKAAAPAEGR